MSDNEAITTDKASALVRPHSVRVKTGGVGPRNRDRRSARAFLLVAAAVTAALVSVLVVGLLARLFPNLLVVATPTLVTVGFEVRSSTANNASAVDQISLPAEDPPEHHHHNDSSVGDTGDLPGSQAIPTDAAGQRDYLNGLVAASAENKDEQLSNLALFKTHKTGSTTLAILLHRYGRRHDLEVAHFPGFGSTIPIEEAARQTGLADDGKRVDIMHYHIDTDTPRQERWGSAKEHYRDVMRYPDDINFITILRDPRDWLLSFYSFFVEFETGVPIDEFFRQDAPDEEVLERLRDLGCKEFGVATETELEDFIDQEIPEFKLVLVTERFDESLMVMRSLLGWDLVDMTYVSVNRSSGRKGKFGVSKERVPFDHLPEDVQEKIDELTTLDRRLYDAGVAAFEESLAPFTAQVDADLEGFRELQTVVNEYLRDNPSSPAQALYSYKTAVYYEDPPPMLDF
ncbi:unnamed protein product [Ectocarpus sp. CCAP 1310/34]|nr:unnamed protein product [Ectocarpus sp. CCAP 1310/34]